MTPDGRMGGMLKLQQGGSNISDFSLFDATMCCSHSTTSSPKEARAACVVSQASCKRLLDPKSHSARPFQSDASDAKAEGQKGTDTFEAHKGARHARRPSSCLTLTAAGGSRRDAKELVQPSHCTSPV